MYIAAHCCTIGLIVMKCQFFFTSVKRRVHLRGCGQEGPEADDLDLRPRLLGHREQRDVRRNPQG